MKDSKVTVTVSEKLKRLHALFPRLTTENQNFVLGEAEGMKRAQKQMAHYKVYGLELRKRGVEL
jgi:hypothetical protein